MNNMRYVIKPWACHWIHQAIQAWAIRVSALAYEVNVYDGSSAEPHGPTGVTYTAAHSCCIFIVVATVQMRLQLYKVRLFGKTLHNAGFVL